MAIAHVGTSAATHLICDERAVSLDCEPAQHYPKVSEALHLQ